MKKIIVFAVSVIAASWLIVPPLVTNAGNADTSTEIASASSTLLMNVAETLFMRVTAYTSLPDETDSTPFITANGTYVHDGIVASNILPFGTRIEIPSLFGDKVFTVEDRTSPRYKDTIDIWMPTYGKAIYFGLNFATILVLPSLNQNSGLSLN